MFLRGQELATHPVVCWSNADVHVHRRPDRAPPASWRAHPRPAYLVGRRTDIEQPDAARLRAGLAGATGRAGRRPRASASRPTGSTTSCSPAGLFTELPPFAIGRPGYDPWLIWRAADLGADVIDATDAVWAVHQRHDYSHVGSRAVAFTGAEAQQNAAIVDDWRHYHSISYASLQARRRRARSCPARDLRYRLARPRSLPGPRPALHPTAAAQAAGRAGHLAASSSRTPPTDAMTPRRGRHGLARPRARARSARRSALIRRQPFDQSTAGGPVAASATGGWPWPSLVAGISRVLATSRPAHRRAPGQPPPRRRGAGPVGAAGVGRGAARLRRPRHRQRPAQRARPTPTAATTRRTRPQAVVERLPRPGGPRRRARRSCFALVYPLVAWASLLSVTGSADADAGPAVAIFTASVLRQHAVRHRPAHPPRLPGGVAGLGVERGWAASLSIGGVVVAAMLHAGLDGFLVAMLGGLPVAYLVESRADLRPRATRPAPPAVAGHHGGGVAGAAHRVPVLHPGPGHLGGLPERQPGHLPLPGRRRGDQLRPPPAAVPARPHRGDPAGHPAVAGLRRGPGPPRPRAGCARPCAARSARRPWPDPPPLAGCWWCWPGPSCTCGWDPRSTRRSRCSWPWRLWAVVSSVSNALAMFFNGANAIRFQVVIATGDGRRRTWRCRSSSCSRSASPDPCGAASSPRPSSSWCPSSS